MKHILDQIVETKRAEVEKLLPQFGALEASARLAGQPRAFREAVGNGPEVAVIAEVKRRSPGAGPIRPDLSPAELAQMYHRGGARAVSVLTDRDYFGGGLADLQDVRDAVPLPVLRKDFMLHPVQIYEARAAGADGILLIVRILSDPDLVSLRELAQDLRMGVLVEAHDSVEVDRALSTGADILGVNNRNLETFETSLDVTFDLLDRLPSNVVLVSESGIRSPADVGRLAESDVDAVLVGESLLRQQDPEAGVRALAAHRKRSHA